MVKFDFLNCILFHLIICSEIFLRNIQKQLFLFILTISDNEPLQNRATKND